MDSAFFSMIFRMKYITRWGLMRSSYPETLSEHSMDTAVLAHALACIGASRLDKPVDPMKAAVFALFHDAGEIITGDMPTPIKYHDPQITEAYKRIEAEANRTLFSMLPDDLKPYYEPVFHPAKEDEVYWQYVKAADKLSALIKCIEEEKSGNSEFKDAKAQLLSMLSSFDLPEVQVFMQEFLPAFSKTLDEQSRE